MRSFGFVQDDIVGGCILFGGALFSTQQIMTPAKYLVIPTAVEGSFKLGSELSSW